MPIPIGNPEAALALAQFYDLKGKVGLSHDEILVGVTIVGSLVELQSAPVVGQFDPFLRGVQPYGSFIGILGPAPGSRPGIQLINPTLSGQLWRVEHIYGNPGVVGGGGGTPLDFEIYGHEPDLGVPAAVFPSNLPARTRDGRSSPTFFTNVGSQGQVASEFPGGGHGQIGQFTTSTTNTSNRTWEQEFKYVMPPDGSFVLQTRNDNNFHFLGVHFTTEPL